MPTSVFVTSVNIHVNDWLKEWLLGNHQVFFVTFWTSGKFE